MLNYVVHPALIEPLAPVGTEIDYENAETLVSVVGFLFLDTRLSESSNSAASRFRRSESAFLREKKIG